MTIIIVGGIFLGKFLDKQITADPAKPSTVFTIIFTLLALTGSIIYFIKKAIQISKQVEEAEKNERKP